MKTRDDFEEEAMRVLLMVRDGKSTKAIVNAIATSLHAAYKLGTKDIANSRGHEDGCRCRECDPSW